jgi:hypothetical protein
MTLGLYIHTHTHTYTTNVHIILLLNISQINTGSDGQSVLKYVLR